MQREELLIMVKDTTPAAEWSNDSFWSKYGHFYFGIGDGYIWDNNALENASDIELLEILVMCFQHWYKRCSERNERDAENLRKVYDFARECRKYIPIKNTSYESNFIMLEKALEFIKERGIK